MLCKKKDGCYLGEHLSCKKRYGWHTRSMSWASAATWASKNEVSKLFAGEISRDFDAMLLDDLLRWLHHRDPVHILPKCRPRPCCSGPVDAGTSSTAAAMTKSRRKKSMLQQSSSAWGQVRADRNIGTCCNKRLRANTPVQ